MVVAGVEEAAEAEPADQREILRRYELLNAYSTASSKVMERPSAQAFSNLR